MGGRSRRPGRPTDTPRKGRPPLLTPALHKAIVDAVELLGMPEGTAGQAYGISAGLVSKWKQRGRTALLKLDKLTKKQEAEERPYIDFFTAIRDAGPKFEMANLLIIQRAAVKGEWRAAKFRLEMYNRDRYGNRVMVGGDPENTTPIQTAAPESHLSDDEALIRAARVLKAFEMGQAVNGKEKGGD
jgi:hypothetical protein